MFNNFSTPARCPTHKVRHDACPPNCIDSLRMSSRTGFANTSQSGDSTSTVGVDSPKPRRGSGALGGLAKKLRKAIRKPASGKKLVPDIHTLVSAYLKPAVTPKTDIGSPTFPVFELGSTAIPVFDPSRATRDWSPSPSTLSSASVGTGSTEASDETSDTEVDTTASTSSLHTKDTGKGPNVLEAMNMAILDFAERKRVPKLDTKRDAKPRGPIIIQYTVEVETRDI
ncbi:hypothetical protein HGRIS_009243 [Hohenbuehelia grisea]|uniref:Uncharacterized protein n=1 Tax=Hohenbuehelia grisea TaxID=104357 RepID=A0ABR3J0J7_9AGAR